MENNFRFIEESHEYWLGSIKLPGVTSILDSVGLISDFAKSETAALRGSLVHKACHYLAEGRLSWASVDPRIVGCVLGYQKFLDENLIEPIEFEQSHYHPDFHYAGTLDALVKHPKLGKFLYDIKTGGPAKYHALQTAAYAGFFPGLIKRATLFLYDDGTYNLRFHNDRTDWPSFISALNIFRLKEGGSFEKIKSG